MVEGRCLFRQSLTHTHTYQQALGPLSEGSSLGFSPCSPNHESHILLSSTLLAQIKQLTQSACPDLGQGTAPHHRAEQLQDLLRHSLPPRLGSGLAFYMTKELPKKVLRPQSRALLLPRQTPEPLLENRSAVPVCIL